MSLIPKEYVCVLRVIRHDILPCIQVYYLYKQNKRNCMKTFVATFLFIAATFLPILFIPLLVLTLLVAMIVSPHVHELWAEPKHENSLKS